MQNCAWLTFARCRHRILLTSYTKPLIGSYQIKSFDWQLWTLSVTYRKYFMFWGCKNLHKITDLKHSLRSILGHPTWPEVITKKIETQRHAKKIETQKNATYSSTLRCLATPILYIVAYYVVNFPVTSGGHVTSLAWPWPVLRRCVSWTTKTSTPSSDSALTSVMFACSQSSVIEATSR